MQGTVPAPVVTNSSIVSMDANGEQDWYKFTVNSAATLAVTVAPNGLSYLNGTQSQITGQCSAGTTFNSLAHADLAFEVRSDATGSTILTTVSATAAGVAETLSGFALPAAGTYFIRVFENNAPASALPGCSRITTIRMTHARTNSP